MAKCWRCHRKVRHMIFRCNYCGNGFCNNHRLPENHGCKKLKKPKDWQQAYSKMRPRTFFKQKRHESPHKPHYKPSFFTPGKVLIIALILIFGYLYYTGYDFSQIGQSLPVASDTEDVVEDTSPVETEGLPEEEYEPIVQDLPEEDDVYIVDGIEYGYDDSYYDYGSYSGCSVIMLLDYYEDTEEASRATTDYINTLRASNGKNSIAWDSRVYQLATARAKDTKDYAYMDHTNPITGTCPDSMKGSYGLSSNEYVAENLFGDGAMTTDDCTEVSTAPMTVAIDSWMTSRGHRYNLMFDTHTAGAVGCYENVCVFLGLNNDRFGEGCHTAEEGMAFWDSASQQPGET